MRFKDFISISSNLSEANETSKNDVTEVIDTLEKISSLKDAKSFISYGEFILDFNDERRHRIDIIELFDSAPQVKIKVLELFDRLIKTEDDMAAFIKIFYLSSVAILKLVLSAHKKEYAEFLIKNLDIDNGQLKFKHTELSNFAHAPVLLKTMIEYDYDVIYQFLVRVVESLPEMNITFDFDKTSNGNSWDGRSVIVAPKGTIPKLQKLCMLAYVIDEYADNDEAKKLVVRSRGYKSFSRSLTKAIKDMMTLTEADLYKEEYAFFLNRNGMPDFIKMLGTFVQMLENANEIGKDIFRWFYNLPRHGAEHAEKKQFLDSFMAVLSNSNITQFINLDCVMNDGNKLEDLTYYG